LNRRRQPDFLFLTALIALLIQGCASTGPAPEEAMRKSAPAVVAADHLAMPADFLGCWEGTIDGFDSIQPLSFSGHFVSKALRVVYKFCYRPESNGAYRLDLTKAEIDGKEATITYFENQVTSADVEHRTGHLRNHAIVVQKAYVFLIFPVRVQQDVFAEEDIVLKSHDVIGMTGEQLVQVNGSDIAKITFHADFNRVPEMHAEPSVADQK
jgi:hypothetical protein